MRLKKNQILTYAILLCFITSLVLNESFYSKSSAIEEESMTFHEVENYPSTKTYEVQNPIVTTEFDTLSEEMKKKDLVKPSNNGLVAKNTEEEIIADSRIPSNRIKKIINEPGDIDPDYSFRGDNVTVKGQLYSVPGDWWNDETVYLYYNITQVQFMSNPLFYQGNLQYEVGNSTTSDKGNFSITVSTSVFSVDPFSKVGDINLFSFFWGHIEVGRGSGSAGAVNVTYYGSLTLDVTSSITNPSKGYSVTTQVRFNNGTEVDTKGSQYTLNVTWETVTDIETNRTFGLAFPYNDIYVSTAPGPGPENVTITVFYNFAPLGLTYFRDNNSGDPFFDNFLAYYETSQTDNQVVIDAYFVVGAINTKTPVEVALGTSFTVFANLTSYNVGDEVGKTIRITIAGGGSMYYIDSQITNASGEIQATYLLASNVTDITDDMNIYFTSLASEYAVDTVLNNDILNANLAVNISSVTISLTNNPNNYSYTPGDIIFYTVTVKDEYDRDAPKSRFQIDFPGIGSQTFWATSGSITLNKFIPDYALINQTSFKNITLNALNETGATYRYLVYDLVQSNVSFDIYFNLSMEFTNPSGGSVADLSVFNNTFYSDISALPYTLTVLDGYGRKPLGAEISITFGGYTVTLPHVNNTVNYVDYGVTDLLASSLNLSIAYPGGITITASVLSGLIYAETEAHIIYLYGPDNDAPEITGETRTPDPLLTIPHAPYFDVTFTITASDVGIGTGINYVTLHYRIVDEEKVQIVGWDNITLTFIGGGQYEETLSISTVYSKNYVQYYIEVKDFAGWGLDELGVIQATPQYDSDFGWFNYRYNFTNPNEYQIGDYLAPIEEAEPATVYSTNLTNPWTNITVFVNDSNIFTDIAYVEIYVNRSVEGSETWEINYIDGALMTHIPGTNQWFYLLDTEYNYEYSWFYIAYDNADPDSNQFKSQPRTLSAIDSDAPVIGPGGLVVDYTGIVIEADTVLNFTIILTDERSGIQNVTVYVDYNGQTILVILTQVGTTNTYFASLDLSDYLLNETSAVPFPLDYYLLSYDNVNNLLTTPLVQLSVVNPPPVIPPGSSTDLNIGALIGGVVGGLVVVIIVLFFWINRHSLQTYAKKQTLRRRLRDYLREIIEEIKRDGVEGRYKEGLVKMWNVVEGVGREFYELPRYKHQTPMEFAFLLAAKAEIPRETMATITYYFEKARYSHEPITEEDYNAGVRALLKTIDQLEVSKMEIET